MMNIGYSAKNSKFPVSLVKELLLYDSETDVLAACHHYGITVENDMIHFYKPHFHIYNNIVSTCSM